MLGGRGRMGGQTMGPGGDCVCPKCGFRTSHPRGVPCYNMRCSKCESPLIRG